MSKQTDSSFLIVSSVPALYQHLLRGVASYEELGNRAVHQIETAHAFRQVERVRELARLLAAIPIREYQLIGQYYLVWCKCREKEYNPDTLEAVAERSHTYKAKALTSRAAFEVYQGNIEPAFYFYAEALKANPTMSDFIRASIGIATLKSKEGFNRSALQDLDNLIPLLSHADPLTYLLAINSYAVEMIENDRRAEAQGISLITLSSKFSPFYPEWQETFSEASQLRQRSTIAFSLPVIEHYDEPTALEPVNNLIPLPVEEVVAEPRVQIAINFMRARLERTISAKELASVVNLSTSHLSHLFKSETGLSPGKYLRRLRMEKAGELLETTLFSVKQIMASVGYNNKSNFSRHFKRHFGPTPSKYRKRAFSRHLPLKF
jgi:AraC-like DNA-binding protein